MLYNHAKFETNWSNNKRDMTHFVIFWHVYDHMSAILAFFQNFSTWQMASVMVYNHVKYGKDQPNNKRDMAHNVILQHIYDHNFAKNKNFEIP